MLTIITCAGVDLGGIPLSRAPQIFRRNTRFAGTVIRPDYQLLPRFGDPILGLGLFRLTCPHVFKQIKKNYFDDDVQSQSSPTKLRRPSVIGMQRRGTRADGHRRLFVVYSARGFLARIVCFEGATPAFQS